MKLSAIASALGATLENGDPNTEITGLAGIEEASTGQISFVSNPKYAAAAKTTGASAVIVAEDFPAIATAMLRSQNPYLTFARAIDLFYQAPHYQPGIHPSAVIAPSAKLGKNAHVAAYVVIDDEVVIGDDAVLLPHVVIYRGVSIGQTFSRTPMPWSANAARSATTSCCRMERWWGRMVSVSRVTASTGKRSCNRGRPILESDVEVQANACVDRASIGETRVASGVKIDNLAQVGHGSAVGEHTLLCAQVGLAGSTVDR